MATSSVPATPAAAATGPAAPTPPGARQQPPRGFLFFLGASAVGANAALLAAAVLTLSLKAEAIDPAAGTTVLSLAMGVSGVFALVAYPVVGRLSDRTTWAIGRRRPYLLLGAALIAAGGVLTALAASTASLAAAQVVTTLGATAATVATMAAIPDQLPADARGPASAVVGLGAPLGAVSGLFLAQLVSGSLTAMILLPAGAGALGVLSLALVLRETRLRPQERPPFGARELVQTFWVNPLHNPAFALAWWGRLLLFCGVAALNAYMPFYLMRELHVSGAAVAGSVFVATLVLTALCLVSAPLAGKASDGLGRRKPFVIASAVVFAVGLAIVSTVTSFPQLLLAIAVVGIGQGVYFAVDLALVTEVLPDAANPAKDLGIMNLANNLPTILVAAAAPALLAVGAGAEHPQNFTALFVAGALASLVGAALIVPIRGVR
ncbi:MFS transporter [Kineococcus glutinatus]|uniref:MFS transporter n=1 Tax=Kineococcus glutinatus TaxID=1070872 RepID=A0ABP9I2W3_9ACTN